MIRTFLLLMALLCVCGTLAGCTDFQPAPKDERTVEIGLLLRRQFAEDPYQPRRCRHIDVLLEDHQIVGFNVADPNVKFLKYLFLHTPGKVRDYEDLVKIRQYYIRTDKAQDVQVKDRGDHMKMVTWWARLKVTPEQSRKLSACWADFEKNPPQFRLFGDNCASRAAESLVCAGILPSGLPGLDTPEHVLARVKEFYPDTTVDTGYFGFDEQRRPTMVLLPEQGGRK